MRSLELYYAETVMYSDGVLEIRREKTARLVCDRIPGKTLPRRRRPRPAKKLTVTRRPDPAPIGLLPSPSDDSQSL